MTLSPNLPFYQPFDPDQGVRAQFAVYGSRRRVGAEIEAVAGYVDSYPEEQHELRSSKTDYPLESGVLISDHLVTLPKRLTLTGFVSDLIVPASAVLSDHTTRAELAWQKLQELHESRRLVDVVTVLGEYSDMAIMRLMAEVNERSGQSLRFTMELEEMQLRDVESFAFVPVDVYTSFAGPSPAVLPPASDFEEWVIVREQIALDRRLGMLGGPGNRWTDWARRSYNVLNPLHLEPPEGLANDEIANWVVHDLIDNGHRPRWRRHILNFREWKDAAARRSAEQYVKSRDYRDQFDHIVSELGL